MPHANVLLEACVDSIDSALAAQEGGAGRIELCAGLAEGGVTPSEGLIIGCRERIALPIFVMIRPRGGDFVYSEVELEVMHRDIAAARRLGADGVVFGILDADGAVDIARTKALVDVARPLDVTFHRAFDQTRDPDAALEALIAAGVDRVLTSGHAPTAVAGIPVLARLVQLAAGRIAILAGGGITEANVGHVVSESGVREVHTRAAAQVASAARYRNPAISLNKPELADETLRTVADRDRIRAIVEHARQALS